MTTNKSDNIEKIKIKVTAIYEMVDIDFISFYLKLKVKRYYQKQLLKFFKFLYIEKIIKKYHLYLNKPCNI